MGYQYNCNFIPGDRVILDANYASSCEVTIVSFTPNKIYATVKDEDGNEWQTMSNRLSEIPKK